MGEVTGSVPLGVLLQPLCVPLLCSSNFTCNFWELMGVKQKTKKPPSALAMRCAVSDLLYLSRCNLCHGVTIKQQTPVITWNCFGHIA